jgi:uncharacterized membrane protein YccC
MVGLAVYVFPLAAALQMFALGLLLGLAVMVLVAHLTRPAVKRLVAAAILACAFSAVVNVIVRADDGDFVIANPCKNLTPSDWEYWFYGCMWP